MKERMVSILLWFRYRWTRDGRETLRQYRSLKTLAPLVLADLAARCHAFEDVYDPDGGDAATYMAIGRRQVWLHLRSLANLDDDDETKILEDLDNGQYTDGRSNRYAADERTSTGTGDW